jgi:hypothetical protein
MYCCLAPVRHGLRLRVVEPCRHDASLAQCCLLLLLLLLLVLFLLLLYPAVLPVHAPTAGC